MRALALSLVGLVPISSSGLIYPLRTAKKPIKLEEKYSEIQISVSESMMNQWMATDAAINLYKGHPVDELDFNRYLIGCLGRIHDHGVVEIEFETGSIVLVAAGPDAAFRMRRVGFCPAKPIVQVVGSTEVTYAYHDPKSGGPDGSNGASGKTGKLIVLTSVESVKRDFDKMVHSIALAGTQS